MKQVAIIGLGSFGLSVALELTRLGHEVIGVDTDAGHVAALAEHITHAVQADAMDETVVKSLGLRNCDVAVVAIGEDVQASLLISMQLKEAGVPLVIAKAKDNMHALILNKIGVDRVVFPERDMGIRLAHMIGSFTITDFFELTPDIHLIEFLLPQEWQGKTLRDINLRAKSQLTIVAVRRGDSMVPAPGADEVLQSGDLLMAIGSREAVQRFQAKH
nr:TrkA family potassium uptake protein [bacterium]